MYAKVFASMWDGTLYGQWEAWSVFVFMLAHADPEGFIDMHPKAIAARSGLPLEVVEKGIALLEAPDEHSRSSELEGRRLELIDAHRPWGWRIVNYTKYRELQDADTIRAQTRERVRRHREKKASVTVGNAQSRTVTDGNGSLRYAEAEGEADTDLNPCHPESDEIEVDVWFEKFLWPIFPRRKAVSKAKALKAFRTLLKATPSSRHDDLGAAMIDALTAYRDSVQDKDPQHILHPETWIRGRYWETLHENA